MKKILLLLSAVFVLAQSNAQVLNTSFCSNATNGTVMATAVDSVNNIVYIGGAFTQVCGSPRKNLAAFNLSTGALMTFSANINANVFSMYYYNHSLYIGGSFTTVNAQSHNYVAKFNTSSNTLSTWAPNITTGSSVNAIVAQGNRVYLGGSFLLTIATGKNICDLDSGTAAANSWPAYPDNQVNAISIDGNSLYAGGSFANVGATPMANLVKFSVGTGMLVSGWAPNPDAAVYSLCAKSGRLFVGGNFSFIGPSLINRPFLADLDTSSADPTGWNPAAGDAVLSMGYRNGHLYAAGNFTSIGGRTKNYLGVVDAVTGIATNWDAQVVNSPQTLSLAPGKIAFGGYFSTVLSQPRVSFAVVCINPIDTITLAPDGPQTVCNGVNGLTYSVAPVPGATSYSWVYNGTGATIHGTSNVVTIDFSSTATSGTLSVKGTNGCESTNMQTISINTYSFTASVNPSNTSMACGDSVDFNSFDNYQGSGTVTYSWSPATGLNASNAQQVTTGTKITRTYTLTETSSEGCVAKDVFTLNVDPYNLNTAVLSSTILCSTTDSLHVTNDYVGFGVVTYTWAPTATVSSLHGANISVNPVTSTDYTVSSTSTDGCAAANQVITVSVDPISLNAGNTSATIVCGEATQLSASNNYPGAGTLTYTWSPSTGLSNTHITNPNASPIATTDYTLTMNSPEGCVSMDHTTISVNSLQVSTAGTYSVNCHQPVMLNTSANTSNPNLTYSWTPATGLSNTTSANPTATVGSNTSYNVTMSLPSSGCADASNSVSITLNAPAAPQICMVTSDSLSQNNLIIWDKTLYPTADTFYVFRDTANNNYCIVGRISSHALSEYADTARHIGAVNGDPNITTYRYKLSYKDSCGNVSPLSPYHNTIYQYNTGSLFLWNAYQIEGQPVPVPGLSNYVLKRDNLGSTGNYTTAATAGAASTSINDPQYSTYQSTADWRVETVWNISCSPSYRTGGNGMQTAIVKSKSNITNNRTTGVKNSVAVNNFSLYPNPTNGNLTIAFANANTGKVSVRVVSVIGQEAYNETFVPSGQSHTIDLSKCESSVYMVQVTTNNTTVVKRVVKN